MHNNSQEIQNNEIIYEELSDHYLNLRNRLIRRTLICILAIIMLTIIVVLLALGIYK